MLSKHREAIEASRSDAPGASQMMTRRAVKGEAPPARHHRAIADAPPGLFQLTLTRQQFSFTWVWFYECVDGTVLVQHI